MTYHSGWVQVWYGKMGAGSGEVAGNKKAPRRALLCDRVGLDVGHLQQSGELLGVSDGVDDIGHVHDILITGRSAADTGDDGAHLGDTIQLALVIVGLRCGCELVTVGRVEEGRTINLGHTNDELCHFESPRGFGFVASTALSMGELYASAWNRATSIWLYNVT